MVVKLVLQLIESMDTDRIAIVLHKAVIQKLQKEGQVPETLTQEQAQASYDKVYDILQESIQKEATLRSIQEIPLAIRNASNTLNTQESSGKSTSEEPPSEEDIQNLVQAELQRRGIQDEQIGAKPPSSPEDQEPTSQSQLEPETRNVRFLVPTPPNDPPPPLLRQNTPTNMSEPPIIHTHTPTSTVLNTLTSSPEKGTDGLRWNFEANTPLLGISRVRIPHMYVHQHPYLLLKLTNDEYSITHPLIHTFDNWYEIPQGKKCLSNIQGDFQITITDPNHQVIPTRVPLKDARNTHTLYTQGFINPETGVALPMDPVEQEQDHDQDQDQDQGQEQDIKTENENEDVILLFEDHAIVIFFLTIVP
jgi:hypothetical protein